MVFQKVLWSCYNYRLKPGNGIKGGEAKDAIVSRLCALYFNRRQKNPQLRRQDQSSHH